MTRFIIYQILFLASLTLAFAAHGSTVGNLASGAVISLSIPVLDGLIANRITMRHLWYSVRYAGKDVRISAAYLFRIKIDDKYLLVKGRRFAQIQPVGGVYKVSSSGTVFLTSINAQDDSLIPFDSQSGNDLRIYIKGSQIPKFYKWFNERSGREDSPWREFYEELIGTGILSQEVFPYVFQDYVKREVDPIRYSEHAESLEILIADVYELLPTPAQEAELRQLANTDLPDVTWVAEETIRRRGVLPDRTVLNVAQHARRIV
ncbi:SMODS-associated NUDIX domain-containing protein [Streptomyces marispadix]|uniref:CD-NTase-associated protein 16 NUDIX domain-containing protein n=1 Tax=Streptomyces marispadix TaxID=2922868 RepID=A0ABS9T250_9ACTN|nr:hypothetical protein [Streptomyces marispadix]MCH6162615.1 hypothetical protein [Streptomyces marispadix]